VLSVGQEMTFRRSNLPPSSIPFADLADTVLLLVCFSETLCSIPGHSSGYLDLGFHVFSQSLQTHTGAVPQVRPQAFPSTPSPVHCDLLILSLDAVLDRSRNRSLEVGVGIWIRTRYRLNGSQRYYRLGQRGRRSFEEGE
jgi:hypothetical protein